MPTLYVPTQTQRDGILVCVSGSRSITNYTTVAEVLDTFAEELFHNEGVGISELIHGKAKDGVDLRNPPQATTF